MNWPFVAEHIARERILGFSTQDLITEMNECNWYNRHANNKTVSCLTLHSISGMSFQVTLILTFELNCFEFEKVMQRWEIEHLSKTDPSRFSGLKKVVLENLEWPEYLNIYFQFVLFNSACPFKGTCPYPESDSW